MKHILDKNGNILTIGLLVQAPEPNDSDVHENEFQGTVKAFRGDYVVVEDGDGDCFDFEPERLEIDESEVVFNSNYVDGFKLEWGQSTGEVTSELNYDEEGSDDLLMVDYFWIEDDRKWFPKASSMYDEQDQAVADYLNQ